MNASPLGHPTNDDILDEIVVFISYSQEDGAAILDALENRLARMPFPVQAWSDRTSGSGSGFDQHLELQLRGCDLVLFVMTPASLIDSTWCLDELAAAKRAKKEVVPLEFHSGLDSERRLLIERAPAVRLVGPAAAAGWNQLEERLLAYASPRRRLRSRRGDQDDLRKRAEKTANGAVRLRLENRLAQVSREVQELETRLANTSAARRTQQERIEDGRRFEQSAPRPPVASPRSSAAGAPPRMPQEQFTDRESEVDDLIRLVKDEEARLVVLHGRDGIGKTAILDRLWRRLLSGEARSGPIELDYLSAVGVHPLTAGSVVRALARQITDQEGGPRRPTWLDGGSWVDRISLVLDGLGQRRVVLALDAIEELLDDGLEFQDRDLADVIDVVVTRPGHRVALLLATRRLPQPLLDRAGERAVLVPRTGGLPSARVRELLTALDGDPPVIGWSDVSESVLRRLHDVTGGSPRAIELCHGILVADDRETPIGLVDLLERRHEDCMEVLLGRVFEVLTHDQRLVLQALAVFRKPVPASAVDKLLQEHLRGLDSRALIETLCEQRLVRREAGRRYVVSAVPDGEYTLGTLRRGTDLKRQRLPAPLTQIGLLHQAADYWASVRPEQPITDVDGLRAQLNEIETRIRGEEYECSVGLVSEVDEKYLVGWGHSGALIPALTKLLDAKALPRELRDEAVLLLVRALFQQERFEDALTLLEDVLRNRPWHGAAAMRVRLELQRATAFTLTARLPAADRGYRTAARRAATCGAYLLAADAFAGRAWCEGWQGKFREALRSIGTARWLLRLPGGDERGWLLANLLEAEGWVYGRLGERDQANRCFAGGLTSARQCGDRFAEGKLLCAQAELAVEEGRPEAARLLAEEAAQIGAAMSGRALVRGAQETIALAHLCLGNEAAAAAAAAVATRHRPTAEGLVMAGLIAYRGNDRDAARTAFHRAHLRARDEGTRNGKDFNLLYIHALALVGMTLCGDRDQARGAIEMFAIARLIARPSGVVERNVMLLRLFDEGNAVEQFTRAARGS